MFPQILAFIPGSHRRVGSFSRRSAAGLDLDQNVVALKLDSEARDPFVGLVDFGSSGDVVFPSVPRTHYRGALEFAFTERTAAMQAGVVDRVEFSGGVKERDRRAVRLDGLARTLRNFLAPRYFDKIEIGRAHV